MDDGLCVELFRNRSMALIEHGDGYCVAELLSDEVTKGDQLRGDWTALGSERIYNVSQSCWQEVYLQGNWVSAGPALAACGG